MTGTLEATDWYMRFLNPLSSEIKISLIKRLSESLLDQTAFEEDFAPDDDIFSEFSSSWQDGLSARQETELIRNARQFNATRKINTL
ncbi:MAG: hypothetical protein IJ250_04115 [Bacteroidales bacterium]|nr:hypothetical protein [Bacteroidales bacterium]